MSNIEWCEETWNPLAGCKPVSPGCANCYAAKMSKRLQAMALKGAGKNAGGLEKYIGTVDKHGRWTGKVNTDAAALLEPLKRKKPTVYFVNSMSDLFHEAVPEEFIDQVFAVMALADWHRFLVLTKRVDRAAMYTNGMFFAEDVDRAKCEIMGAMPDDGRRVDAYVGEEGSGYFENGYLANVGLGASVENQACADERVPLLLSCKAAMRFLSCEPLLEAVDLKTGDLEWCLPHKFNREPHCEWCEVCVGRPNWQEVREGNHDDLPHIDWIIGGGESGPGARAHDLGWSRHIKAQCEAAGTAYFQKQLGAQPVEDGHPVRLVNKKGGDMGEWPIDLRVRQRPEWFFAERAP